MSSSRALRNCRHDAFAPLMAARLSAGKRACSSRGKVPVAVGVSVMVTAVSVPNAFRLLLSVSFGSTSITSQSMATFISGVASRLRLNLWPTTGLKSFFMSHPSMRCGSVSARQIFSAGWGISRSTTTVRVSTMRSGLSAGARTAPREVRLNEHVEAADHRQEKRQQRQVVEPLDGMAHAEGDHVDDGQPDEGDAQPAVGLADQLAECHWSILFSKSSRSSKRLCQKPAISLVQSTSGAKAPSCAL